MRQGWFRVGGCIATSIAFAGSATAAVSQPPPDSTPLPQPVPADEIFIAEARGFPADALTLQGLFFYRGEALDEAIDASDGPGFFTPLCDGGSVQAELVLVGGGCEMSLAWYNVTNGEPPAAADLFELVPSNAPMLMSCEDPDFCPLATRDTIQTGQHQWLPRTFEGVCNDARYTGGDIGFAVVPDASESICTQIKYSEPAFNVTCSACDGVATWVTTLIYESTGTPNAVYLGVEDLPMAPEDWRNPGAIYSPDGDCNDHVFFVSGVCHAGECDVVMGTGGTGGSGATGSTGGGATGSGGTVQSGGTAGSSTASTGSGTTSGSGAAQGAGGDDSETGGSTTGTASGGVGPPAEACEADEPVPCRCDDRNGVLVCNDAGADPVCSCPPPSSCACTVPSDSGGSGLAALAALALAGSRRWSRRRRESLPSCAG